MRDHTAGSDRISPGREVDPWAGFDEALTRLLRRRDMHGALEFCAPDAPSAGRNRCRVRLDPDGPAWATLGRAGDFLVEELLLVTDPTDPGRLAHAVITACREQLGLPHPQLLTLRAEGPVASHTGPLRLIRSAAVPVGRDPADYPNPIDVAVEVDSHEDARQRYEELVERVTGRPCVVDDDGHIVFDHVGHHMHIEFTPEVPFARIWAWVVRGVRSRSEAALEIARLNREDDLTSWVLDGRHVLQRTTVPVAPFLPRHAQSALEHFLFTYASTRDSIAGRLGPR